MSMSQAAATVAGREADGRFAATRRANERLPASAVAFLERDSFFVEWQLDSEPLTARS